MATVIVHGSKNDFAFGPDLLEIPDDLAAAAEAGAVLAALLQADDPDQLATVLAAPLTPNKPGARIQATQPDSGETPQQRAIHCGFTALLYRHPNGRTRRIV